MSVLVSVGLAAQLLVGVGAPSSALDEAGVLVAWVRTQPPSPDLLVAAVLRWVDSHTDEKLQGTRLLAANPLLLAGTTRDGEGARVADALTRLVEHLSTLLPGRTPQSSLPHASPHPPFCATCSPSLESPDRDRADEDPGPAARAARPGSRRWPSGGRQSR